jgi:hypothetical protein
MTDTQLHAGQQVAVEGMDSARSQQPDEVEGSPRLPQAGAQLDQGRKLIEFT